MSDVHYMQRALELAKIGRGTVSPNPMVGCVIVHDNQIIGEGWHQKFGEAHAEVNAVNAVADKQLLSQATFFVTLEPCSYHGKTPACTDLILKHRPQRVVIASKDPNPKVSGQGIRILKDAGIKVDFGVLETEAMALNKRFYVSMLENRPYIVLKWAQTADGFIARKNFDSKWISNEYSRQLVHKWRTEEDAILVGFNTARYDNPRLTSRYWPGRNPVRVVIDPKLNLDKKLHVFTDPEPVWIINTIKNEVNGKASFIKVSKTAFLKEMLAALDQRNIGSVLVEGGSQTLNLFLEANQWDEIRLFESENKFSKGIKAPVINVEPDSQQRIMGDTLTIYTNPKTKPLWQKR